MLDVIGKALEENSITYTTLHSVGNVQVGISKMLQKCVKINIT